MFVLALTALLATASAEPPKAYTDACATRVDLNLTLAWLNWMPQTNQETKARTIEPVLHRRTFSGPVVWTSQGPEARSLRCAASDPLTGEPSLKKRENCGIMLVDAQIGEINRVLAEGLGLATAPACPATAPKLDRPACPTVDTAGLTKHLLEHDPKPPGVRAQTFPSSYACALPSP